jgi:serine/threonine protein kinase
MASAAVDMSQIIGLFATKEGENMKGAVGTVRRVTVPDGAFYYVKKMVFREGSKAEETAKNEIELNEYLTKEIPDVVSQMVASAIVPEDGQQAAYLVFEGLVGMDSLDYMRRLPSDAEIARIVACVREKVDALHAAEYVHLDLQEPNLFVVTDAPGGSFVDCRLIDFGNSKYLGEFEGDEDDEEEWAVWERKKRRWYARDKGMLDELEDKLKKIRDFFAGEATKKSSRGGYRRRQTRGRQAHKKRGQTRRRC